MRHLRRIILLILFGQPAVVFGETLTCVSYHSPPWVESSVAGASGLAVDIVEKILEKIGYSLEMTVLPPARAIESVKIGSADCVFTLFNAKEYGEFLDFSMESVVPQVVYFFARKDSSAKFNGDFGSIRDLRIGTTFKAHYGTRFEAARPQLMVDEALTLERSFLKLVAGRIDLVPTDPHAAAAILALPSLRRYADRIVKLPIPSESVPMYVAFSKVRKLASLRDEFDTALRRFVSSQDYRILLSRYGMNMQSLPASRAPSLLANSESNPCCK